MKHEETTLFYCNTSTIIGQEKLELFTKDGVITNDKDINIEFDSKIVTSFKDCNDL